MKTEKEIFIWSDGWHVEKDQAWFVSGLGNMLFHINLKTDECEFVIGLPNNNKRIGRLNPKCIKCRNSIYCIPNNDDSIWIYNIDYDRFTRIKIDNPDKVRLQIEGVWEYNNIIYVVSYGLHQVIKINIEDNRIENCYVLDKDGKIVDSVSNGTIIYVLFESGKIMLFDMETGRMCQHALKIAGKNFHTICVDENTIWLSGYCKEVYVWDKKCNEITTINNLPEEFGIYNFDAGKDGIVDSFILEYEFPIFEYSLIVGSCVWFIPLQTNKIIYIDRGDFSVHAFEIDEEDETRESLLRHERKQKYLLEYVIENRYIGLFSVKNRCILEIDTKQLKYRWREYSLSNQCLKQYIEIRGNIFWEKHSFEKHIYSSVVQMQKSDIQSAVINNIGRKIYDKMKKNDEKQDICKIEWVRGDNIDGKNQNTFY